MGSVVNYLAWTRYCSCFKEIYAEAVTAEYTMLGTYTIAVQVLDAAFRYVVLRESCDEFCLYSVVCKRYGYVSLSAAECCLKLLCLGESEISRCLKAKHDLAECNDFCHINLYYYTNLINFIK